MTGALSIKDMIQLAGFPVLIATGQILFKLAAQSAPTLDSILSLSGLLRNPWLWLAILLYGVATLLWVSILQKFPLSLAYPFVALSFVIVPALASLVFGEPLTLRYALGVAVLLVGVCLATTS